VTEVTDVNDVNGVNDVVGAMAPSQARVAVVGCGLMGTSVAMALQQAGCTVFLDDLHRAHQEAARQRSGGAVWAGEQVDLVVVATTPDAVVDAVLAAHESCPSAALTDVASVKAAIVEQVAAGPAGHRFVGGHPMAGSAASGPEHAQPDLFHGRPWILTPHAETDADAVAWATAAARWCGARVETLDPQRHDAVVARVSHAVQVLASAAAAGLLALDPAEAALSGPALREVTRVAASDAGMWRDILTANSGPVSAVLTELAASLSSVARLLETGDAAAVEAFLRSGNAGRRLVD